MAPRKKDKALTAKEEIFCYEYVKDMNAQAAARRAGYAVTPQKTYAELLKRPNIKALVDRLVKERKARCSIDADGVLQEIIGIARADLNDYLTVEQQEYMRIPKGKKKAVKIVQDVLVFRDLNKVDTRPINSIKQGQHGISFKLNDKVKALDMLGKHFGLWKDGQGGDVDALGQLLVDHMNKRLQAGEKKPGGKQKDA